MKKTVFRLTSLFLIALFLLCGCQHEPAENNEPSVTDAPATDVPATLAPTDSAKVTETPLETAAPTEIPVPENYIGKVVYADVEYFYSAYSCGDTVLALTEDGALWGWGNNSYGQIAGLSSDYAEKPFHIMDNVASFEMAMTECTGTDKFLDGFVLALTKDGELYSWGTNNCGQLGTGAFGGELEKVLDGVERIELPRVEYGEACVYAFMKDGSLYGWGLNDRAQIAAGDMTHNIFAPVKILDDAVKLFTAKNWKGEEMFFAVQSDGDLYAWGESSYGALGDGGYKLVRSPVKVLEDVDTVVSNGMCTYAIKTNSELWAWGFNSDCSLGLGHGKTVNKPAKVMDNVSAVRIFTAGGLALTNSGEVYGWGTGEHICNTDHDQHHDEEHYSKTPKKLMENVRELYSYDSVCFALTNDGTLLGWGYNYHGSLGAGMSATGETPVAIAENVSCFDIVGSEFIDRIGYDLISMSYVIKNDGSLCVWGANNCGQLGTGDNETAYSPVCILQNAASACLTDKCQYCLTKNGGLYAWGDFIYGDRWETPDYKDRIPKLIAEHVVSVACSEHGSIMLTEDGAVLYRANGRDTVLGIIN